MADLSRRALFTGAAAGASAGAALLLAGSARASTLPALSAARPGPVNMALVRRAITAMKGCQAQLKGMDRLAVVDFSLPSDKPRMHLIDLDRGSIRTVLVAHGRGSDPHHTGWVQRFSNVPGSYASSSGSYVTGDRYVGKHGRSLRLSGLDESNCNAERRAIVIHAAWYVNETEARKTGLIGRSEGCFAVAAPSLDPVLDHLGSGRFLYAEKSASKVHVQV